MKFKFSEENTRWWDSLGDDCVLSAGRPPVLSIGESSDELGNETRIIFGNLVHLLRQQARLSVEEFASEEEIDVGEILSIERDPTYIPDPRTVHQIAARFKLPEDKLMGLAGITQLRNHRTLEQGLKFAARSESPGQLSQEQLRALEEFVRLLCEK